MGGVCIRIGGVCNRMGGVCVQEGGVCNWMGGVCVQVGGVCFRIGGVCNRMGGVCIQVGGVCISVGGICVQIGGVCVRMGGVCVQELVSSSLWRSCVMLVQRNWLGSTESTEPSHRRWSWWGCARPPVCNHLHLLRSHTSCLTGNSMLSRKNTPAAAAASSAV